MASNRECNVCTESVPQSSFPKPTAKCTHQAITCLECLKKHVQTSLKHKNETLIRCVTCKNEFESNDLKTLLSPEDFAHWDTLKCKQFLQTLPEFKWCSHRGCGSGQLVEGGDANSFWRCCGCKQKNCFRHQVEWHADTSCEQYDQELTHADKASQHWIAVNCKKCPKCQRAVQKNGGCDHMTCRVESGGCGHEFCWLCLADYCPIRKDGNHRHATTCQYYA